MTEHGAVLVKVGKLSPRAASGPAARPPSLIESPWVVLPMLFLDFRLFALPMLWRSRRFTRGWKIGLTVIVLLLTVALGWYLVEFVKQTMKALDPLFKGIAAERA